jgi:hypothetical protein
MGTLIDLIDLNFKKRLTMPTKPTTYKSFLIRIWNGETDRKSRVMVTRINESGEQYYFANLDDLMMFLIKEVENQSKGELPMG